MTDGTGAEAASVACPECGRDTRMGLPRSAEVEAVVEAPDEDLDDSFLADHPRRKRRETACEAGHAFHVYFEF